MSLSKKRGLHFEIYRYRNGKRKKEKRIYTGPKKEEDTLNFAITAATANQSEESEELPVVIEVEKEVEKPQASTSAYTKAKQQRIDGWTSLREDLLKAAVAREAPTSVKCATCGEDTADLFRCLDCFHTLNLCLLCIRSHHPHPHLHMFEMWKNGTFVSFFSETPVWKVSNHECTSLYEKEMVIVDEKGRQHIRIVTFCGCEAEPITLIKMDLWPSSPKQPRIAFHMDLLRWLNSLLLECHISVKGFVESLLTRHSKHHRGYLNYAGKDIYQVLMRESFEEFRYFLYNVEHAQHVCSSFDDGTSCPACYRVPTKVVSFDADFQLVRKLSAGHNWNAPKHEGHFFLGQAAVDQFMEDYSKVAEKEKVDCNDFQAGNSLRAKVKNKKLSETAVFGSVCRHEFPQHFFSLRHGERLGYSVYLLQKMLEKPDSQKEQLHIMYDIACSLHQHLKKRQRHDILEKITLSIPIFHCYGHKRSCQIVYGPRRAKGIGLSDGEGMERLWSYLGKFARITKEMTPENRVDLLVDGLIHYGNKVKSKLGPSLLKKIEKAKKLEETSQGRLDEIMQQYPRVDGKTVQEWMSKETEDLKNESSVKVQFSWQEVYAITIDKLDCIRAKIKNEVHVNGENLKKQEERLQNTTESIEKRRKVSQRWDKTSASYINNLKSAKEKERLMCLQRLRQPIVERIFLLRLMKKYANGQSVAIRLSRQLKKIKKNIDDAISAYNEIGDPFSTLPQSLCFENVKSPEEGIWKEINKEIFITTDVPSSIQSEAIELTHLIQRCKEEKQLVQKEMVSVLDWYSNQYNALLLAIKRASASDAGRVSVLSRESLYIEMSMYSNHKCFEHYIEEYTIPSAFRKYCLDGDSKLENLLQYVREQEDLAGAEEEDEEEEEEEYQAEEEENKDETSDGNLEALLDYILEQEI